MDSKKLGLFIAQLRAERGFTQTSLANELNISNRTVSKWEHGNGFPDITILPKLAEVLGVTTDELLAGERLSTEEEKEIQPKFFAEFMETAKDWTQVSRFTMFSKIPVWQFFAIHFCLLIIVVNSFIFRQEIPTYIKAVAVLILVLMVLLVFFPNIEGFCKILLSAQMSGGKKQPTKYRIGEKILIDEGSVHQEFALNELTGVFEKKNIIILRFHKNVYGYIPKSALNEEEAKELVNYLSLNGGIKQVKDKFKVFRIIIIVLLCAVTLFFTGVTFIVNYYGSNVDKYESMTAQELLELNHDELYQFILYDFYYEYVDENYGDYYFVNDFNHEKKTLFIVFDFYLEFENGGLCQYLWNSEGYFAEDLYNSLVEIGCEDIANEYNKFLKDNEITDFSEFCSGSYENVFEKYPFNNFDDSEKVKDEKLYNAIIEYTRNNIEKIKM